MTTAKITKIVGWILSALLAALFLMGAVMSFIGGEEVAKQMGKYGLEGKAVLIGSGNLISTVLFLVPLTLPLGTMLLSGYMGGAIMVHMSHGEPYVFQSVILVLIWVAAFLRRPHTFIDRPPW